MGMVLIPLLSKKSQLTNLEKPQAYKVSTSFFWSSPNI